MAVPFLLMMVAGSDLGRYFVTQHSLHTLISEALRTAAINCAAQGDCDQQTALPDPARLWDQVPFLSRAGPQASLTARQWIENATGARTITVTASYGFSFVLPIWTSRNGAITETTQRRY